MAHPFLAAAGLDWLHQRAGLLSAPSGGPSGIPYAAVPPQAQVWPYLGVVRSGPFVTPLGPLVARPQQRWGLIAQPNFVFNGHGGGAALPALPSQDQAAVMTYQAAKHPDGKPAATY